MPESFTLSRGTALKLRGILSDYCRAADATYVALLEESGALCADAGDEALRDHGETAALAVAACHAVHEVARRLGDSAFEGLSHEGSDRHSQPSTLPVDCRTLLLTVFGHDTRHAIVRACARRAAGKINAVLAEPSAAAVAPHADSRAVEGDLALAGDYFLAAH